MKIIIRAFVIVLALTGAVASTQASTASARKIASSSLPTTIGPVPTCEPDGSTDCGISQQHPTGK